MKYAFIVNPVSGQGKHDQDLIPEIEELIAGNPNRDIRVYHTRGPQDATVLADLIAGEATEEIVIFACGGDGTVQEVANGIIGHDKGILGVIPAGSGNDFVKALSKRKGNLSDYRKLTNIFDGMVTRVDMVRMSWIDKGEEVSRYITNGINIGFDGNTAVLAHQLKKMPLVSGPGSYLMAVAVNLAAKRGQKLRITADGRNFYTGALLLATVANGGYCGGGIQSCPNADMNDGLLEVMAIRDVTRKKFVSLFPKYKAGKIFQAKGMEDIITYAQSETVLIEPMLGPKMRFSGDGEIFDTGAIRIEVVPKAIKVMVL